MRKLLTVSFVACTLALQAQEDPAALVNPFIGSGGHGHTFPGASMPFGAMQLSPDTRMADWDGSSGYHYSDSVIYGFSHTHLSGTGIPDYCDVLLMPFMGPVQWKPENYRSAFSHVNEKAAPGYYEVLLRKHQIKARLTTAMHSGMHEYRYGGKAAEGKVLLDLLHRDEVLDAGLDIISPYEVRGWRSSRSWAQDQRIYFHIRFERPMKSCEMQDAEGRTIGGKTVNGGKGLRAAFSFLLGKDRILRARIGISAVDTAGARKNLEAEIKDWNFNRLQAAARKAWNAELKRIEVKGGSRAERTAFYTALYHASLVPNIFSDVDGRYRGTDGRVHHAREQRYTVFSLWDTYRAYHPFMSVMNRKRTAAWINTFLDQYKKGGMLPVWELGGNETFCMIGYHSIPVILDAYRAGIRDFDTGLALEAMRSYAESNRFGLGQYRDAGYISNDQEHESVSKTLEYAFDDWCISEFARLIGENEVAQQYAQRGQYYRNLFDPVTRHMRGKTGAAWHHPFDPKEINNFFTEGNAWHYAFAVPQDIEGMIRLYGGRQAFAQKLEELFTTDSKTTGRDQADVTGLIGQYAHGNEPSHHMAYLFLYAGRPSRTQELVARIMKAFYPNQPDGLIGNEDCGQMSAWLLWSAAGLYPVTPGSGVYAIGTPLFDTVRFHLENGKTFTVTAKRSGPGAFYVSGAGLNGKPLARSFIQYEDIAGGSTLSFSLSDKPQSWGSAPGAQPPSSIEPTIAAVPYFERTGNKFRDTAHLTLASPDPGAAIFYRIIRPEIRSVFVPYEGPVVIDASTQVQAYAEWKGLRSRTVTHDYHKLPNDFAITVKSKVHPMYTAGGPDALIDGLTGDVNWRTGNWQSYFNTDFEAVVDLRAVRDLAYVGIHVLQDVSPWIIYPGAVRFYISDNGQDFTEIAQVVQPAPTVMEPASTRTLGKEVQVKGRYLKVIARNGGSLPAWHESRGNPSHLFIDEIVIR